MKKFSDSICKNRKLIIIISLFFAFFSIIGMTVTRVNYDILVYLPDKIDTIKGQKILTEDFDMGAYSIVILDNMKASEVVDLEDKIREVDNVAEVFSLYDVVGTNIPVSMLPSDVSSKLHKDNSDLLMITFDDSTSSESTLAAVDDIENIIDNRVHVGGMSSMVLDTMNLSNQEILIYVVIAVFLCLVVLGLALDSYIVPVILLLNIGFSILFNMGTNIFLGDISYITKALVSVLQLGVTTDFSIFLYHAYESKKKEVNSNIEAMSLAIRQTFSSVTGSSLTTIAGFLALCSMQLTLGMDLGLVMAKGVLIGVICVLTLFPSLLLVFDKLIEKTKHKVLVPNFNGINEFLVKHHVVIFIIFIVLIFPAYLANSKVDVYYKLDKSLPEDLMSISTNDRLKNEFNIVSPEMVLIDKNMKNDDLLSLVDELKNVDGVDFVLSAVTLKNNGIVDGIIDDDIISKFENDKYQVIMFNSLYDIATDELNNQVDVINDIVKKYDKKAIVAGEGPLMKDLINISDTDFNNVNRTSIFCIFLILFIVLRSISLPILLIVAIEFAIFMNMGISYFSYDVLPFVAPIVLGTIQLGATIDYAILMTTTYLSKRIKGIEKEKSMVETMNYSGNSIFVSGMCFFAATFGVGLYSKLDMIGEICNLISRGAIISMIVVIAVLPSILLIFDKVIMKTTLGFRKDDKNVK